MKSSTGNNLTSILASVYRSLRHCQSALSQYSMQALVVIVLAALVTACASIGRPEGGPRDTEPPVFVSSNPAVGAKNISRQQIDLYFNENVQLQDAFNKVVVSPAQTNPARVTANGKHVRVELQDTLKPNTTYTIDFADAIKDLNEGNILDGFATCFSTGAELDTLSISGMVLEARTLEPAQGMLVGVYSNLSDTAIRTLPLERIARTNQLGQFSVLNLKPGNYRIYALNDLNRDYYWDRSEDVAFYDVAISPYVEQISVTDTLRSYTNQDSLVVRDGVAFLPNDILLTWFNEGFSAQYLKDYKRPDRRHITIQMAAQADSLPEITVAEGPAQGTPIADWALLKANTTLDSLEYWITDPEILSTDSLYLSVRYQRTDTANMLEWRTDTLKFFYKEPKQNKKSSKKEEAQADTMPKPTIFMPLSMVTGTTHDVYMPLIMKTDQPIDSINPEAVHLEVQQDTLWLPVKDYELRADSLNPLFRREILSKWEPGAKYRLSIDSASVFGIYDEHNNAFKHEFTVKPLEEYANLVFNITGTDSATVVELLDKSDKVIKTATAVNGKATFKYLNPGTVYARLYIDRNHNGKWDTGNLIDSIQPEEVFYYPKKINLKKNWDVSNEWNIYELPIDMQKPYEIKTNKPKLKKGEKAPRTEDEEEEEDDMFSGYNTSYGNARRNSNTGGRTGRNTNALGTAPRMR